MKTKNLVILSLLFVSTSLFALANPAATNCINKGNRYMLVNNVGVCLFPDGSYCEEWAYFRNQCRPGQNMPSSGQGGPNSIGSSPNGQPNNNNNY